MFRVDQHLQVSVAQIELGELLASKKNCIGGLGIGYDSVVLIEFIVARKFPEILTLKFSPFTTGTIGAAILLCLTD